MVKSPESAAIEAIRALNITASRKEIKRIELSVPPGVANFLLNHRRAAIAKIEAEGQKQIIIRPDQTCSAEQCNVICYDDREGIVKV